MVIVAGGFDSQRVHSEVELLYFNENGEQHGGWIMGPSLPEPRVGLTLIEYLGSIIALGGNDDTGFNFLHLYKISGINVIKYFFVCH